jgi:NDP-sugar pyrophosphorylase family protein
MKKINVVVPMAGAGSRFVKAGFKDPKPLINIHNKHMIEVVINNLKPKSYEATFIFVCQRAHFEKYNLDELFRKCCSKYEVVCIDGVTEGAACTVLKAKEYIDNDIPLMIANSDQWCDFDIDSYLNDMFDRKLDGTMLTMKASDPKWSYAKLNEFDFVTSVVEKIVVSDEATVGIYNYSKGSDFVTQSQCMIEQGLRSNGEYYVAPVYTLLADKGAKIGIYNVGEEANGMYGLGIPSDLDLFVSLDISKKATDF